MVECQMKSRILKWLFKRYKSDFAGWLRTEFKYQKIALETHNMVANQILFAKYYFGVCYGVEQQLFMLQTALNYPKGSGTTYNTLRQYGKTTVLVDHLLTILDKEQDKIFAITGLNMHHIIDLQHHILSKVSMIKERIKNEDFHKVKIKAFQTRQQKLDLYEFNTKLQRIHFPLSNNHIYFFTNNNVDTATRGMQPHYIYMDEYSDKAYEIMYQFFPNIPPVAIRTPERLRNEMGDSPHWVNKEQWDKTKAMRSKE